MVDHKFAIDLLVASTRNLEETVARTQVNKQAHRLEAERLSGDPSKFASMQKRLRRMELNDIAIREAQRRINSFRGTLIALGWRG